MPSTPTPARRGNLQKTIMAWSRTLHIYLTLTAFLALAGFSFSGFVIHHPEWFEHIRNTESTLTLPTSLFAGNEDKIKFAVTEYLRANAHVTGTANPTVNDDSISIEFHAPSRSTTIDIDRPTGNAKIRTESRGILGILGDLHQGKDAGKAWDLVIDATAITLFLAACTGILIWTQLSKRRTLGLICLTVGIVLILGVFMIWVP